MSASQCLLWALMAPGLWEQLQILGNNAWHLQSVFLKHCEIWPQENQRLGLPDDTAITLSLNFWGMEREGTHSMVTRLWRH